MGLPSQDGPKRTFTARTFTHRWELLFKVLQRFGDTGRPMWQYGCYCLSPLYFQHRKPWNRQYYIWPFLGMGLLVHTWSISVCYTFDRNRLMPILGSFRSSWQAWPVYRLLHLFLSFLLPNPTPQNRSQMYHQGPGRKLNSTILGVSQLCLYKWIARRVLKILMPSSTPEFLH